MMEPGARWAAGKGEKHESEEKNHSGDSFIPGICRIDHYCFFGSGICG